MKSPAGNRFSLRNHLELERSLKMNVFLIWINFTCKTKLIICEKYFVFQLVEKE